MRNRYLYLFFVVLMVGCGNKSVSRNGLVGEYIGKVPPSYLKRFYDNYIKNVRYGVGQELILRADSTYSINYCRSTGDGKWKLVGDSLILTPSTQTIRNDSLKTNPFAKRKAYCVLVDGILEEIHNIEAKDSPWGDAYISKSMLYKIEQ